MKLIDTKNSPLWPGGSAFAAVTMTLDPSKGDFVADGKDGLDINAIGVLELGVIEQYAGVRVIMYEGAIFVDESRAVGETVEVSQIGEWIELPPTRAIRLNGVLYQRREVLDAEGQKLLKPIQNPA